MATYIATYRVAVTIPDDYTADEVKDTLKVDIDYLVNDELSLECNVAWGHLYEIEQIN